MHQLKFVTDRCHWSVVTLLVGTLLVLKPSHSEAFVVKPGGEIIIMLKSVIEE
jgi:hypothetical protein